MIKRDFITCFNESPIILTEGSIELRMAKEFGVKSDEHIRAASRLYDAESRRIMETVYGQYLQIAEDYSLPILVMASTRRLTEESLWRSRYRGKNVVGDYVGFLRELADRYECQAYIGGMIGCKGDAYTGEGALNAADAAEFHRWSVNEYRRAGADYIFAPIMPAVGEIIGLATAIGRSPADGTPEAGGPSWAGDPPATGDSPGMGGPPTAFADKKTLAVEKKTPYIISFMIRRNGRLIDGHTIHDAICEIDGALDDASADKPLCYMTNCVYPDILRQALSRPFNNTTVVKTRFMGIEANAANAEPEELDSANNIIASDADELLDSFIALDDAFPLKIYGGCCGTNETHIRSIARYFGEKNTRRF